MSWGAALGSAFSGVLNFGASMSNQANENMLAANQAALQKEFAQSGVQWRVADARAAGIHPIYAMGASLPSYTPISIGSSSLSIPDLGSMGQNIERALTATRSQSERDAMGNPNSSVGAQADALRLENMQLQNDLLRTNIIRANAQIGPPMPVMSPGGGLTGQQPGAGVGVYEPKPTEVHSSVPGRQDQAGGPPVPGVQWSVSPDRGGLLAFPAPKLPGTEDEGPIGIDWYIRNRLNPVFNSEGMAPTLAQVQAIWPGAIGARFSRTNLRWEPVFGDRGPRFIGASAGRQPGINEGVRMLRWNRYRYER